MLDTHCHVDLYEDPSAVVDACEKSGIYTIAVTNAPSVFRATEALTAGMRFVRPAVGIHPELAVERRGELPMMWEALVRTRYVGEVGLDYTTSESDRVIQRRVFSEVLEKCHELGGRILTVHSRRAASDVVSAVDAGFDGKVILHWYSGGVKDLRRGVLSGFYFSINPAMTLARRFPTLLAELPRNRVLIESDGPFVTIDGRPATPRDVGRVLRRLAEAWGVPMEEAKKMVMANFREVLEHPTRAYSDP